MASMKSATSSLVSSNMVTSPCISSTNMETTFLSSPYTNTITTTHNNNYISSTSSSLTSNNNSSSTFNTICMFSSIDPSIVQTELIGLSMNDVTCSEVTSSSPLLHDLEGIEVLGEHSLGDHNLSDHHLENHLLGDHNLLPTSLADSPGLSSPDTLDSTYITLSNLRPHSAYSDVSSLSGRDDVSSPSSIFGGFEASSMGGCLSSRGNDLKKKKGPAPRQQEDLCLVCGDRASGYHYNALTCEGCKGFFRRSITKKAVYQCKFGSECDIDMYMRRKCQECRFKKCISVGMREECVIPEVQCRIKREQKKARETEKGKEVPSPGADSNSSQVQSPGSMMSPNSALNGQSFNELSHSAIVNTLNTPYYDQLNETIANIPNSALSDIRPSTVIGFVPPPSANLKDLNGHEAEIINKLLYNQDHYEIPTSDNLPWYKSTQGVNESLKKIMEETFVGEKTMRISHMLDMTLKTVQLIVEFAKRVPGFETLMQDDQIELLKPTSSEIMMLRAARRYDLATDSIVYCNNYPYKREVYDVAGLMDTNTDHLFRFCKNLAMWKVDNAEYALLTAVVLFSDRPRLKEPEKVEKLQDIYLSILQKYVDNKNRGVGATRLAKLLSCLTELRTLAYLNNVQCHVIHNEKQTLPSLLCNMWDVHQDDKGSKEEYL